MKFFLKEIQKNKFKISTPTWNDIFELNNGAYSVSDVQDYFEYIIKKLDTFTDNPPVRKVVNKTENKTLLNLKLRIINV